MRGSRERKAESLVAATGWRNSLSLEYFMRGSREGKTESLVAATGWSNSLSLEYFVRGSREKKTESLVAATGFLEQNKWLFKVWSLSRGLAVPSRPSD